MQLWQESSACISGGRRHIVERGEQAPAVLPVGQHGQVGPVQLQGGQLQQPGALPQHCPLPLHSHADAQPKAPWQDAGCSACL